MIHALKIEKKYFEEVITGRKTFELRDNDRNFEQGDFLALNEIETGIGLPDAWMYTGRCCLVEVIYILEDNAGRFLQPGYVCMSIRPCRIATFSNDLNGTAVRNMYEVPTYTTVTTKEETK